MGILHLLAKDSFITYNKSIARIIGVDEAIVFGELCSICNLHGVEFFCEQERLIEDTCLTEYRLRNALKNLQQSHLVSIVKKGMPAKNYYTLNEQALVDILYLQSTCGVKFDTTGGTKIDTTIIDISTIRKNEDRNKNNNNMSVEVQRIIDEYANGNSEILELLLDWIIVRKAKKAPITKRAIELNIKKLDHCASESNMNAIEYLKEVVARGWAAFYVIPQYGKPKKQNERYGSFDPDEAFKSALQRSYGEGFEVKK